MTGVVSSDRMEKTITVVVERRYKHPKYGKYIVASKKYSVHDESNDARIGDEVEISETRPLSKNKRWRPLQVVTRAPRQES
jgi:small subunit ribosomal protein S17